MAKERIIYNNYDLCNMFDDARAFLLEEHDKDEITDSMVWDEIYFQDSLNWQDESERLTDFFTGHGSFLIRGYVGRWDENGHFYLKCSHHDGTNLFEIKRLSDAGYSFIDNWEYNWDDERSERQIHDIVWNSNFLSSLPHFAHTVYGCRKREV